MLFRWLFGDDTSSRAPTASEELRALVARSMPGADPHSVAVVGALAGLLATVAHVDRRYSDEEEAHVRTALAQVHGMSAGSLDGVCELLRTRMAELAHESLQTYTRVLYEGLERSARLEVLDVLMELGAADEVLDMAETTLLRRIARGLGLADEEYTFAQQRFKERLSLLSR
jgi:uncharacterized tellurite resistance protein B-like protein